MKKITFEELLELLRPVAGEFSVRSDGTIRTIGRECPICAAANKLGVRGHDGRRFTVTARSALKAMGYDVEASHYEWSRITGAADFPHHSDRKLLEEVLGL